MNNIFNNKKAIINLEQGKYEFELSYNGNMLTWTTLPEREKTETENAIFVQLNDAMYSISWVEASGITVTHIIDLNLNKVWATWSWNDSESYGGRQIETHVGSFHFISENSIEPLTNVQIVTKFWNEFFNKHNVEVADMYLAAPYIQHNPYVPDGVEAFKEFFITAFHSNLKDFSAEIKHSSSTGDLVFLHNHQKNGVSDVGNAALDIFRVKNGKLVEHWDVIQTIPESSVNNNTMF